MAPQLLQSAEADELRGLAQRVREWQLAKGLSDNALVRKFPDLGSTKTFTRILTDDLAELDLERQLANYRAVVALIESLGEDESQDEQLYDDLSGILQLRRAFVETQRERGPARCIIVQGDSGTGKSSARRIICEKFGSRMLTVEASSAWNDRPGALLGHILTAAGQKYLPSGQADRLDAVIAKLGETRRCLIIEEAHHLGPRSLNAVKTLINETPGEFVLITIPTLWRRLEHAAYEEARQLSGNRLAERVKLSLSAGDIKKLLTRRIRLAAEALVPAVNTLLNVAPKHGNLALVREICQRIAREHKDEAVTLEQFSLALSAEVASR